MYRDKSEKKKKKRKENFKFQKINTRHLETPYERYELLIFNQF